MNTYAFNTEKPEFTLENARYENGILTISTDLDKKDAYILLEEKGASFTTPERILTMDIDCPVCGGKVENALNADERVEAALFTFNDACLRIRSALSLEEIRSIAKGIEPGCSVYHANLTTHVFTAVIDCLGCAAELEENLKKAEDVSNAEFDFMKKRLTVTSPLSREEVKELILKTSDEVEIEDDKAENEYTLSAKAENAEEAKKIEAALKENRYISDCAFNFKKKELKVITELTEDEVKEIAKKTAPSLLFFSKEEEKEKREGKVMIGRIVLSIILLLSAKISGIEYIAIAAYVIAGYDVLVKAFKNILKGKALDENFLMAIATIGALFINSYGEAAAVMVLYQIGEALSDRSVRKSRKSISALLDIKAETAHLKNGDTIEEVPTSSVKIGSLIVVKAGEKIPLDGEIVEGRSEVDYKALTGESVPVEVMEGMEAKSGGINGSGLLTVKTSTLYSDSTVKKIIDLVENAKSKKTKSESFITRFSRYYTPSVCALALLVAVLPPLFFHQDFSSWLYRGLMLLVISCPCALVISVPLSYFSATGAFAKRGILIKNSGVVENLARLKTVCFDKTGTLTKGEFRLVKTETKEDEKSVLRIAASLETLSTHPIAKALKDANKLPLLTIKELKEIPGKGLEGEIEGSLYSIERADKNAVGKEEAYTGCCLKRNGETIALFLLGDEVKAEAKASLEALHKEGVEKLIMLSGDREAVAEKTAQSLGMDGYKAELMPSDKINSFEEIISDGAASAYVGDGINDSPVLSRADVGISMGGVGSDSAIEASDMVLMNDNLEKLPQAVKLAKRTQLIVRENIYFSIAVKAVIMAMAILGVANMWLAIFADVGVSLIATANATRPLLMKK